MMEKDPLKDLELLIRSRYCITFLDTAEEDRAETLLKHLADHLRLPFFCWTRTKGLRQDEVKSSVYGSTDPSTALAPYRALTVSGYLLFPRFRRLP